MTINLDKTYCASPNCVGKCGRKKPDNIPQGLNLWYGYFCCEPVKEIEKDREKLLSEIVDACLINGYVPPLNHKEN